MIEVREVKTRKEIKDFLNFPLKLYKGNKCFVPPIYGDEKKCFKKDYFYYEDSEAKYWNAYKDGKIVGRISAFIQRKANEKWHQKRCRFTRFDALNDQEIANALFEKVTEFAKERGMEEIVGPLGFSDLEREGLLIEGFDYLSTFEEQYNYSYYQTLLENYGFEKDVDWIEHRLTVDFSKSDKIINLSEKLLVRNNLHFVSKMRYGKFIKKYGDKFFEILDISYDKIYGTVPFTKGMKNLLENNFKPIVNMNYVVCLLDNNDNIVAFAVAFPAIGEIMQKSNGHLTPLTIIRLLREVKHPHKIDLGLVGVIPGQELTGTAAIVYGKLLEQLIVDKVEYVETNLNLEDNTEIVSTWSHFHSLQHKRRRAFVKKI